MNVPCIETDACLSNEKYYVLKHIESSSIVATKNLDLILVLIINN